MKYGIAVFPEKKVQDIANSYRKRYDPHYSLIPPHITLKQAFEMDDDQLSRAIVHLDQVAQQTSPFEARFTKVSTFHPTNNVIFLSIADPAPFKSLHEKINQGCLQHEESYDFIPHLTIGQSLSDDELHDVYGSLRMSTFDLSTRVDCFHLLYQLENGSWTIYQSFLLNQDQVQE
ncbi:putative phosphoesterase YjcG [Marinithermofilum abyssi]|uniref:Putative phosphoesterase GCM10011571_26270 n=1 Tax=Marinithermofilum abyssi TaxID=1571185 RepID=A0A8J2YEF8_9BACL|nr:YjcG family protein [Marinithermofilum abyssi]GGE22955.1 putative phosphoesterase YjcG [Marinithermofilum abyssi]